MKDIGVKGYDGSLKSFGRKLTKEEKRKIRENASGYICAEGCGESSMRNCEWHKENNCPF